MIFDCGWGQLALAGGGALVQAGEVCLEGVEPVFEGGALALEGGEEFFDFQVEFVAEGEVAGSDAVTDAVHLLVEFEVRDELGFGFGLGGAGARASGGKGRGSRHNPWRGAAKAWAAWGARVVRGRVTLGELLDSGCAGLLVHGGLGLAGCALAGGRRLGGPSKIVWLIATLGRGAGGGRDDGRAEFAEVVFEGEFFHDCKAESKLDQVGVFDLAVGFVDADELGSFLELFFGHKRDA